MRRLVFSLLLVSAAATPALAAPVDEAALEARIERQQQAREERQQAREDRQQSREERQRFDRPDFARPQIDRVERIQAPQREERPDFSNRIERPQFEGDRLERAERRDRRRDADSFERVRTAPEATAGAEVAPREQRLGRPWSSPAREAGELRQHVRPIPDVLRRAPVVSNVPREGTQPPVTAERHRRDVVRWDRDWRKDQRHDWRSWRDRHRSVFRVGFYYDPFGWGYRPYSVGWRLWPSYYSSRYWLNDPWMYRLPYAPAGTRWIRYWDDAILVDTWTGQVVDVIHNFFW